MEKAEASLYSSPICAAEGLGDSALLPLCRNVGQCNHSNHFGRF